MPYNLPAWMHHTTKPLPCPFCGSEPWGVFGEPGDMYVECDGDDCGSMHFASDTREEAVLQWNRRASPAQRDSP